MYTSKECVFLKEFSAKLKSFLDQCDGRTRKKVGQRVKNKLAWKWICEEQNFKT